MSYNYDAQMTRVDERQKPGDVNQYGYNQPANISDVVVIPPDHAHTLELQNKAEEADACTPLTIVSILSTILCSIWCGFCGWCGLVGTIHAYKARYTAVYGDPVEARSYRNLAWAFTIAGIVCGTVALILYIILLVVLTEAAKSADEEYHVHGGVSFTN